MAPASNAHVVQPNPTAPSHGPQASTLAAARRRGRQQAEDMRAELAERLRDQEAHAAEVGGGGSWRLGGAGGGEEQCRQICMADSTPSPVSRPCARERAP